MIRPPIIVNIFLIQNYYLDIYLRLKLQRKNIFKDEIFDFF